MNVRNRVDSCQSAKDEDRLTPRRSSSALIWWLIAAFVTRNSSAGVVNDRCRVDASKARSALSGMGTRAICP